MKAITLHQPWATLILLGAKHYETRSWPTTHRGPLAIHASKLQTEEYRRLCATDPEISAVLAAHNLTYDTLPFGAILGTCQVGQMHRTEDLPGLSLTELACGDYSPGRYAWALSDAQSLVKPLPCRGFQQLWTVPAELARQVLTREALATALTHHYGTLVQPGDIVGLMGFEDQDDPTVHVHVRAKVPGETDWYAVAVNSAGQLDPTSITLLPF